MTMTLSNPSIQTSPEAFLAAGFEHVGANHYRRGSLAARLDGDWLVFDASGAETYHLPRLSLGQLGLWKPQGASGYVFEIPQRAVAAAEIEPDAEDGDGIVATLAAWADATLWGTAPQGWQPPAEGDVRSWLPAAALAIQRGPLARQIEVVCEPARWALRSTLVSDVSGQLSAARRASIERQLHFVQRHWRLVRLGFGGSAERPSIAAEVDLTGCPGALARELAAMALAALRQVVGHELLSLVTLANPRATCGAWEI